MTLSYFSVCSFRIPGNRNRQGPPVTHLQTPKMATTIRGPGLILAPDQNPGQISFPFHVKCISLSLSLRHITYVELNVFPSADLVPTAAHAGTTRAPVPDHTDAGQGADLAAGVAIAVGAIAVHQCQTVADTLATGYVFSALLSIFVYVYEHKMFQSQPQITLFHKLGILLLI